MAVGREKRASSIPATSVRADVAAKGSQSLSPYATHVPVGTSRKVPSMRSSHPTIMPSMRQLMKCRCVSLNRAIS